MKVKTFALATAGALMLAGAANAALTSVQAEIVDNGMDGVCTVQIAAYFDSGSDLVEAVFGNSNGALSLNVDGGLWNDDLGTGLPLDDTPALGGDYDTWVGFVGDTQALSGGFTPNFWGVAGGGTTTSVLVDGVTSLSDMNSSYFIAGGASVDSIDSTGRVVIAQFSHTGDAGSFSGGVQYNQGTQAMFSVDWNCIPAPGALALLGLAGIAGRRRRG